MNALKLTITAMRATALEAIATIETAGADRAALDNATALVNQRFDNLMAMANLPDGMDPAQLDRLDAIAKRARDGKPGALDCFGALSTGERLYIALALSRMNLVPDYTIAEALARLGEDDVRNLVQRWQYR